MQHNSTTWAGLLSQAEIIGTRMHNEYLIN